MPDMRPPITIPSVATTTANLVLLVLGLLSAFASGSASAIPTVEDAYRGQAVLPPGAVSPGERREPVLGSSSQKLEFKLKHIYHHGTWRYPSMHRRLDVPPDAVVWMTSDESADRAPVPPLRAGVRAVNIQRLVDRRPAVINSMLDAGRLSGKVAALDASAWTVDELPGPNMTDKETVLSFANMASNAYVTEPHEGDWVDVGRGFNYTEDFGWQSDGLRGHIFADTENSTIVIGVKGTSPAVFDGSETTGNDKINDNLFFGCCCGQGGQFLWKQVCDCQTSAYTCNSTCLVTALKEKNRYYYAIQDLYHNVTALYPNADIWVTGHSLGGATVSLLALTYGLPAVTFEAPGEAMPAARLNLPTPPGYNIGFHQQRDMTGGYHFGHTADPIFMGICNTANSFCTLAGYAMQSRCHTGLTCTYDTVKDLGWRVGIGTHRIRAVIDDVIVKYPDVPECKPMKNCTDCYPWEFFESNGTDRTTTSKSSMSSTTSKTRTQTCKTPGWWGCLDESTTTGSLTTTTTSITTTSEVTKTTVITTTTCKTPGWFGCNDAHTHYRTTTKTSTSTKTITPMPAPTTTTTEPTTTTTTTTTCEHPGWFGGCKDDVTTTTVTSTSSTTVITPTVPSLTKPSPTTSSPPIQTSTCSHPGWFGCKDPSATSVTGTSSTAPTPTTTSPSSEKAKCKHRNWLGRCTEWNGVDLVDDRKVDL